MVQENTESSLCHVFHINIATEWILIAFPFEYVPFHFHFGKFENYLFPTNALKVSIQKLKQDMKTTFTVELLPVQHIYTELGFFVLVLKNWSVVLCILSGQGNVYINYWYGSLILGVKNKALGCV